MPYRLLVPAIALVSLAACGRGGGAPPPPGPAPLAPFPAATRIYYDNSGGISDSLRVVVRDADEFGRIWRQATSQQGAPPPAPQIDFTRDMVIIVSSGRLTPDDQIQIDSVGVSREMNAAGQMQETLSVFTGTTLACRRIEIDAYPLEIVRVRRFDGPIRFIDRRRQAENCVDAMESDG